MDNYLNLRKHNLELNINRVKLVSPAYLISINENILKGLKDNLNNLLDKYLIKEHNRLDYLINTLKLVHPLNILSNGYSLVRKEGKVIKNSKDLQINDVINIKLYKGEVVSIIQEVINDK